MCCGSWIFGAGRRLSTTDLADKTHLAQTLATADRKLILELKTALHSHPEYRKSVYSVDIYNFALDKAGTTPEDFWRYLEKR